MKVICKIKAARTRDPWSVPIWRTQMKAEQFKVENCSFCQSFQRHKSAVVELQLNLKNIICHNLKWILLWRMIFAPFDESTHVVLLNPIDCNRKYFITLAVSAGELGLGLGSNRFLGKWSHSAAQEWNWLILIYLLKKMNKLTTNVQFYFF